MPETWKLETFRAGEDVPRSSLTTTSDPLPGAPGAVSMLTIEVQAASEAADVERIVITRGW